MLGVLRAISFPGTSPRKWLLGTQLHRSLPVGRIMPSNQLLLAGRHPQKRSAGNLPDGGVGDEETGRSAIQDHATLPTFEQGVNWFCYTTLGLLFAVDFTPLGRLIGSQDNSGLWLSALQWGLCVLPTLLLAAQQGWDIRRTFKVQPTTASWAAGSCIAGAALWYIVAAAISLKSGPVVPEAVQPSVMGQLFNTPTSVADWMYLAATASLSPAAAEELLFRGFLLTALQSKLGRVDAVMLSAAFFAAIHLSISQFFPFCVLGIACGAVALASGSVAPAIILHASHNAAALLAGALMQH